MNNRGSVYIYYISGTGNARSASYWIADEAEKNNINIRVQQIDRLINIDLPPAGSDHLIGFAFPTHGFNAAPIMLRFIAGFPRGRGKEVFLLNTRGGLNFQSFSFRGLAVLHFCCLLLFCFSKATDASDSGSSTCHRTGSHYTLVSGRL